MIFQPKNKKETAQKEIQQPEVKESAKKTTLDDAMLVLVSGGPVPPKPL